MADNYIDKINKILSKPIIPEKIEKEKLSQPVAFPDADATEEEIADFLYDKNYKELAGGDTEEKALFVFY